MHQPTAASDLKTIQRVLWDRLHEHLKSSFERRLLDYIDQVIQQCYPNYCSSDGRVIDRRLAKRIGVNPAMLSRLRAGDSTAMTKLSHFLAMMNLCGIQWCEGGFQSPQQVVLDALTDLFPIAQDLLGITVTDPPTNEQILILYFAGRLGVGETDSIGPGYRTFGEACSADCARIIEMVACAETDLDGEAVRLIDTPRETSDLRIIHVLETNATIWNLFRNTFPFLGKPNRHGEAWGIF